MSRRLLILLALLLASIMVSGCCCCCGSRKYYSPATSTYRVTVVPTGFPTPNPVAVPPVPTATVVPVVVSP